jgi:site-specific DNA-methyltransferase (adenine-specific)
MTPYWEDPDSGLQLYLGDMREILPALGIQADCIVTDPPYAETSLAWDRWPDGWPQLAATVASSMWCFGSMRMFLDRSGEFVDWKLSQDVVWEKNAGTGFAADRFKRVHEHALHWYRGDWRATHHDVPRQISHDRNKGTVTRAAISHTGAVGRKAWTDDGTRLMPSVIYGQNMKGRALHPTEKPVGILDPLIRYACPPGGLVLDPFTGSGSALDAARQSGRRAIGIEAHEPYAEAAALRLSAMTLPIG